MGIILRTRDRCTKLTKKINKKIKRQQQFLINSQNWLSYLVSSGYPSIPHLNFGMHCYSSKSNKTHLKVPIVTLITLVIVYVYPFENVIFYAFIQNNSKTTNETSLERFFQTHFSHNTSSFC